MIATLGPRVAQADEEFEWTKHAGLRFLVGAGVAGAPIRDSADVEECRIPCPAGKAWP